MKNRKYVTVFLASFFIAGLLAMGCVLNTSSSEMPTLPIIWAQPLSATYKYDTAQADVEALDVIAGTNDNGATLSYQWYQNSTKSNKGGALRWWEPNYKPTIKAGTGTDQPVIEEYYYVVVTSTKGSKSVSQSSEVAVITTTPKEITNIDVVDKPEIKVSDGKKLKIEPQKSGVSYQWYKINGSPTTKEEAEARKIKNGAILVWADKEYVPPLTEPGDLYYFVAATATNNSKTGIKVRRVTSDVKKITVTPSINAEDVIPTPSP
jgi:hypothetical protein